MHNRFEERIEEGLEKIASRSRKTEAIAGRRPAVGRLLGRNSLTAGAFQIEIVSDGNKLAKV